MKLLILGGSGLLGQHAALEAVKQGIDVTLLGRYKPAEMLAQLVDCPFIEMDLLTATRTQLVECFSLYTNIIMALGPDDRSFHEKPIEEFYQKYLIDFTRDMVKYAQEAGVKSMSICGSYFTAYNRQNPELKFIDRHPYVQARQKQIDIANEMATSMKIAVLEIPYVFGAVPNQVPMWKDWLFERLRKMPVVFYPKGGSAVISAKQVGQALISSINKQGVFTLVDKNLTWRQLLKIILPLLKKPRHVINAPRFISEFVARRMKKDIDKQGKQAGIDPDYLMRDIMYKEIFFDPEVSHSELEFERGGIPEAIAESVMRSY